MSWLYRGLGAVLSFFDKITGSYLIAIFLFAFLVQIVLFPLSIKQQKNQQKQASLRPKEMAIRKKYKGKEQDREMVNRMNAEVQQMYQQEGFNPLSGCLPTLIQLPIILLVYNVIVNPLSYISKFSSELITSIKTFIGSNYAMFDNLSANDIKDGLYNASELQITSLLNNKEYFDKIVAGVENLNTDAYIPNFSIFGANLGEFPFMAGFLTFLWLVPVFNFLVQFGTMKLNRKLMYQPVTDANTGCSYKIMDIVFPAMSFFMSIMFPAILGIYWIFRNILSLLQQLLLRKIWPLPTFTEEDYKNAERALRVKQPARESGMVTGASGKVYRSLHHIDDDDYETAPVPSDRRNDPDGASDDGDSPKAAERAQGDAPELKEDNPDRKTKKDKNKSGK